MASEVNTRRWPDMAIGELLAASYIAELPKLSGVHWTLRISQEGWMEIVFDSTKTENTVERMGPSLAARIVMHTIEQTNALQTKGIEAAQALNNEMLASIKQELGL